MGEDRRGFLKRLLGLGAASVGLFGATMCNRLR